MFSFSRISLGVFVPENALGETFGKAVREALLVGEIGIWNGMEGGKGLDHRER